MTTQKHCPGCFQDKAWAATCPACSYDEAAARLPVFLPHGTVVGGQFRIGRVLGKRGGFGITYLGWDVHLQQRVAIKEYLPRERATRRPGELAVRPHSEDDGMAFDLGREQFLREARIVASFDHPNIVRVRSFFRANGTAYLVMDYYEGISLGEYLSVQRSRLQPLQAVRLMRPVLDGLQYVHERGVVHRDLKPHNIYLASVGRPIVLDFGAARRAAGDDEGHSVVVSEGYAPLEQYQRHAAQGPWTDLYAAGATLYRMITGEAPPMALDRIGEDTLVQGHWHDLPPVLRPVLARAMAMRAQQRFQSARDFRVALDACVEDLRDAAPPPAIESVEPAEPAWAHLAERSARPADAPVTVSDTTAPLDLGAPQPPRRRPRRRRPPYRRWAAALLFGLVLVVAVARTWPG